MQHFITELQTRPDGIVNSTLTARSSYAMGLAYYYQRAAAAVANQNFVSVALTLQNQDGFIIENQKFDTLYEEPNEENPSEE